MKLQSTFFIFFIYFFHLSYQLTAQFVLTEHHEYILDDFKPDEFEVLSLGEDGILVYKILDNGEYSKQKQFVFEKLDTNLVVKTTHKTGLPFHFSEKHQIYLDGKEYLYLLSRPDSDKKVVVFRLNIPNFTSETFDITLPNRFFLNTFKAIGDELYLLGDANDNEVGIGFNFISKTQKILPNFFDKDDELNNFLPNPLSQQMIFGLSDDRSRVCDFSLKPYSALIGEQKRINIKAPEREQEKKTFKNWRLYPLSATSFFIFGGYSLDCSNDLTGTFSILVDNQVQKRSLYKPFFDFFNIYRHYSERKAIKLETKREEMRKQGKQKNITKKMYAHPQLYEFGEQVVFVMENYYQQTNNNTLNSNFRPFNPIFYNPYPRWQNPTTTPVNYIYSKAILCAWNKKGEYVWDNFMNLEELNIKNLEDNLSLGQYGDSLVLAYTHNEKVFSKLIHKRRTIKEQTEQKLEDLYKSKYNITNQTDIKLKTWYKQNFLLINEISVRSGEGKKTMFQLQKLTYQSLPLTEKEKKKMKVNKKNK
ncbi:MAG: hypothetical protein EAZ85_02725 [Bacteroidetes bacterium]|nr:MAG: hypothetical protein EAZ85_02725 [Bacteroidota bacterium]TAG86223.1 MAG: hypothetical protein EAZ20_13230 [Bacteroidota bacterium]